MSTLAGYSADVRAIETALLSGDLTAVPRLLDATGIDKVIVRHPNMISPTASGSNSVPLSTILMTYALQSEPDYLFLFH